MSNARQLLYQTEKSSHQRFFCKNTVLKNFAIFMGNTCVKILRTPVLKNICAWLLLNGIYEVIVWNFVSGSHLLDSVIVQKYQYF